MDGDISIFMIASQLSGVNNTVDQVRTFSPAFLL